VDVEEVAEEEERPPRAAELPHALERAGQEPRVRREHGSRELSPEAHVPDLALFFSVGIVALVWPERVQDWMLNFHESGSGIARWNPFL
jgi:hypothetical protein